MQRMIHFSPTAPPCARRPWPGPPGIDCCWRKLDEWAVADHMHTEPVTDALKAAAAERASLSGVILHADHRAQYSSKSSPGAAVSSGSSNLLSDVGSSAGNAPAESCNATLQRETLTGAATYSDETACRRENSR